MRLDAKKKVKTRYEIIPIGIAKEKVISERVKRIKSCEYEHDPMPNLPYCVNKESLKVKLI